MNNGKGGIRVSLTTDEVHLTKEGYKILNELVMDFFEKINKLNKYINETKIHFDYNHILHWLFKCKYFR